MSVCDFSTAHRLTVSNVRPRGIKPALSSQVKKAAATAAVGDRSGDGDRGGGDHGEEICAGINRRVSCSYDHAHMKARHDVWTTISD